MFKLFSTHGKCLDNTEEMLPEMKTFYQQLYSEKKVCNVKIEDYVTSLPKLTENEPDLIEGLITLEEASKVLKKKKKKAEWLVSQLLFSAQSTTKDYITAKNNVQSVSYLLCMQVIKPQILQKPQNQS